MTEPRPNRQKQQEDEEEEKSKVSLSRRKGSRKKGDYVFLAIPSKSLGTLFPDLDLTSVMGDSPRSPIEKKESEPYDESSQAQDPSSSAEAQNSSGGRATSRNSREHLRSRVVSLPGAFHVYHPNAIRYVDEDSDESSHEDESGSTDDEDERGLRSTSLDNDILFIVPRATVVLEDDDRPTAESSGSTDPLHPPPLPTPSTSQPIVLADENVQAAPPADGLFRTEPPPPSYKHSFPVYGRFVRIGFVTLTCLFMGLIVGLSLSLARQQEDDGPNFPPKSHEDRDEFHDREPGSFTRHGKGGGRGYFPVPPPSVASTGAPPVAFGLYPSTDLGSKYPPPSYTPAYGPPPTEPPSPYEEGTVSPATTAYSPSPSLVTEQKIPSSSPKSSTLHSTPRPAHYPRSGHEGYDESDHDEYGGYDAPEDDHSPVPYYPPPSPSSYYQNAFLRGHPPPFNWKHPRRSSGRNGS